MVAKCANPDCNCEFRELSKGRLFLLPPTYQFPETIWKVQRMIDHCHWLCPACATTHTIVLENNQAVVRQLPPKMAPHTLGSSRTSRAIGSSNNEKRAARKAASGGLPQAG